ncbi:MAG: hypothetical protein ACLR2D_02280 [Anaerobutyricum hallii]
MEHFLEQNQIWLVPIITILLTVIIKMSARNQSVDFRGIDFLDFGFDLSISAIVVLLTNVRDSNLTAWFMLLFFVVIMIITIIVNRIGWNTREKRINLARAIIPDIIGIFLLVVAILYVGGTIK